MVGLAVGESVPVGEVLFSELQLQRVALVLFLFEGKEIHLYSYKLFRNFEHITEY